MLLIERRWKVSNKTTSYIEIEESKLRDHFAGLAMQAEMSRDEGWSFNTEKSLEEGCRFAYKVADAMLKARKEVKP